MQVPGRLPLQNISGESSQKYLFQLIFQDGREHYPHECEKKPTRAVFEVTGDESWVVVFICCVNKVLYLLATHINSIQIVRYSSEVS